MIQMIQRKTIAKGFLAVLMSVAIVATPAMLSAAPPSDGSLTTGIVQTIPGIGMFVGSLTITSFQLVNGVINAVGTLTGTFTPLVGAVQMVNQVVSIPLTGFTGTCTILTLHTGAISLNLACCQPVNLLLASIPAPARAGSTDHTAILASITAICEDGKVVRIPFLPHLVD